MAATRPDAQAFSERILDRLIADNHGDVPWTDLVLAAGTAALDGHAAPRPARKGKEDEKTEAPEPPGAYLIANTQND